MDHLAEHIRPREAAWQREIDHAGACAQLTAGEIYFVFFFITLPEDPLRGGT